MSVNGENGGDGVNSLGGDFGASELARIGEQYKRVPYSQRELRRRYKGYKDTVKYVNSLPGSPSNPFDESMVMSIGHLQNLMESTKDERVKKDIQEQINSALAATYVNPFNQKALIRSQDQIKRLRPRLQAYNETRADRLNAQAVNSINREMSDSRVNSFVSGSINTQEIQVAGLSMAGQNSFEDLMARRESIMREIGGIRSRSVKTAHTLVGKNGIDLENEHDLKINTEKVKQLAEELGPIAVAMKTLRSQDKDPDSRRANLTNMESKAQNFLRMETLENNIRSGVGEFGNLTPAEMKKKELEAAQNLIKAMDELRSASGKSKEEIAKFSKEAEDAASRFKEVQEAGRAGAGDPNNSWLRTGAAVGTAVANVAGMIGNYFQVLGINQPNAAMSNAAGYANLENMKHDSWRAALAGNMTERMNLAGWKIAQQFGLNRADLAGAKVGADVVSGVAGTIAGGLQTADALSNAPGGTTVGKVFGTSDTVNRTFQGVQATGESALIAFSAMQDAGLHLSTSQAEIYGQQNTMNTVRALNHIPGWQMQQYRDHMANIYAASMHMGGRGEVFLNSAAGGSFLNSMSQFGIGSDEVAQLGTFGGQNIGSMFDPGQITQAKRFENLGLGAAGDQLRRMASLAAGGTQNPGQSLEKLLERAVSVGLDSSKSITMIADATGAVAEQNAMRGVANTGDEISRIILGAVDRNNPNQEFASKQAVAAFQTGEQARNNRAASFHGMIAVSRLQKQLGLNWFDAYALQGLSAADLRSMGNMGEDDIKATLYRHGIDGSYSSSFMNNLKGSLRTVVNSKVTSQLEAGGGFAIGTGDVFLRTVLPWIEGGKGRANQLVSGNMEGVPADVAAAMLKIRWNLKNTGAGGDPTAQLRDAFSVAGFLDTGNSALGAGTVGSVGGSRGALLEEMTRGNRSVAGAMRYVLGSLTNGSNMGDAGIAAIRDTGRITEQQAGQNPEAMWAQAAAKSAADFGASATRLDSASGKLTEAADKLMYVANVMSLASIRPGINVPPQLSAVRHKLDEWAGQGQ